MSIENEIRKKLLAREVLIGSWVQLGPYPALAEILANAGYEWI